MTSRRARYLFLLLPVLLTSVDASQTKPPQKAPSKTATSKPAAKKPATAPRPPGPWDERVIDLPIVGKGTAYIPTQPTSTVFLFMSGDGGWNLGVVDMARRMMPKGIVIGFSYPALRKAHLNSTKCWQPAGDLEEIAHAAERELKLPAYIPPVLVGYSSGATAVYAGLAAAPPQTFAGGLSLGFCPDLPSDHPVCNGDDFKPTFDQKKNTAWLPKVKSVPREWYVVNGVQDQVCIPGEMHTFLDDMGNVHFLEAPGTGHGFGRPARWGDLFDEAVDGLVKSSAKRAPSPASAPPPVGATAELEKKLEAMNLPLEYRWAASPPRAAAIFISGDGGWATLDDKVATYLAGHGVNVVGMSALRYFWNEKTPEQTGEDVKRIADVLAGSPLFVGGYSFGAEVTPFVLQSWPDADRKNVRGAFLIAPGETASFEVSTLDWVFRAKETPRKVADAVKRNGVPTFCLAGQTEASRDTACDDLGASATAMRLPGSHHFNGDYDAVAKALLDFIDSRLGR